MRRVEPSYIFLRDVFDKRQRFYLFHNPSAIFGGENVRTWARQSNFSFDWRTIDPIQVKRSLLSHEKNRI